MVVKMMSMPDLSAGLPEDASAGSEKASHDEL